MERAAAARVGGCGLVAAMDCTEYTELLQPYVDAELDVLQECAMEAHHLACAPCTDALDETRALVGLLDRMERDPAPPGMVEAILCQLPCPPVEVPATAVAPERRLQAAGFLCLVLGAAAFVALLLALGATLVSTSHWTARLSTLATWCSVWVGDLEELMTWLGTTSQAELAPAMRALLRAAGLLLQAATVPLLVWWSAATVLGLARHSMRTSRSLRRS